MGVGTYGRLMRGWRGLLPAFPALVAMANETGKGAVGCLLDDRPTNFFRLTEIHNMLRFEVDKPVGCISGCTGFQFRFSFISDSRVSFHVGGRWAVLFPVPSSGGG